MRFSTRRWAYSGMSSFLSQSVICCMAAITVSDFDHEPNCRTIWSTGPVSDVNRTKYAQSEPSRS
jgi:hypothetical protein